MVIQCQMIKEQLISKAKTLSSALLKGLSAQIRRENEAITRQIEEMLETIHVFFKNKNKKTNSSTPTHTPREKIKRNKKKIKTTKILLLSFWVAAGGCCFFFFFIYTHAPGKNLNQRKKEKKIIIQKK